MVKYDIQKAIETNEELPLHIWSEFVKQRDNFLCRKCERGPTEYLNLISHHTVWTRHGGKNTMSNGVTLCGICHNEVHFAGGWREGQEENSSKMP